MDDVKRENNKIKRSKTDVKNVVAGYLLKRNYPSLLQTFETTGNQHITHSLLENGIRRSNSILESCYNSDPVVIDHNFTKFLIWLKDQIKHKGQCHDIEQIVGPLFCHLYMDILRGEHSEKAASFLKCHLPAIDENKCDIAVKDLIKLFATDGDSSKLKEKFRSEKIVVELRHESLTLLKKFVLECCNVVFLQVLQTWFDIHERKDGDNVMKESSSSSVESPKDSKYQDLLNAVKNLRKEPIPVYNIKISNNRQPVSCGLMKRQCGFVAFAEYNILRVMPINCLDSLFNTGINRGQLKLINHSDKIYAVAISVDNNILVSASADHSMCIYNLANIKLQHKCIGHLGPIYCAKISSNGEYVATGSVDATARLWDVKSGKILRIFSGHTQSVICLEFHPNCLYLATGSADRNIRLWCLNKASPLRLLHAANGTIYGLAFNPSGRLLASTSEDKKIRVWDLLASKVIVELRCKDAPVLRLIWNKDGSELCAGTIDGVIRVWDFASLQDHPESNRHYEPILTQSVNGKLLSLEYTFGTYGTLTTN